MGWEREFVSKLLGNSSAQLDLRVTAAENISPWSWTFRVSKHNWEDKLRLPDPILACVLTAYELRGGAGSEPKGEISQSEADQGRLLGGHEPWLALSSKDRRRQGGI